MTFSPDANFWVSALLLLDRLPQKPFGLILTHSGRCRRPSRPATACASESLGSECRGPVCSRTRLSCLAWNAWQRAIFTTAGTRSRKRSSTIPACPQLGVIRNCSPTKVSTARRSEEHTSELQSRSDLVCRLLLEKKKKQKSPTPAYYAV